MADTYVKCKYCGEKVRKSQAVIVKTTNNRNQYVCATCLDDYNKQNQDVQAYTKLTDYIQYIYMNIVHMDKNMIPWKRIAADIQTLEKKGYKRTGMLLTLKYAIEIEKIRWQDFYGVEKIIMSYYDIAKDYLLRTRALNKVGDTFEPDEEVVVHSKQRKNNTIQRFTISMEDLQEE